MKRIHLLKMMKVSRTSNHKLKVTEVRNGLRDRMKRTHSQNLKMMKESRTLKAPLKDIEAKSG